MKNCTIFLVLLAVVLTLRSSPIQARPSYLPTAILPAYEHHLEYAPTIVGHTAYSLPTAISHQSQTIIHEKRPILTPIIEHTPILKATYPAHVLKSAYLPTASVGSLPTVYSGLTYASLYDNGWSPSLSGWVK